MKLFHVKIYRLHINCWENILTWIKTQNEFRMTLLFSTFSHIKELYFVNTLKVFVKTFKHRDLKV